MQQYNQKITLKSLKILPVPQSALIIREQNDFTKSVQIEPYFLIGTSQDHQSYLIYSLARQSLTIKINPQETPTLELASAECIQVPLSHHPSHAQLLPIVPKLLSIYFSLTYQTTINTLKHQNCAIVALGTVTTMDHLLMSVMFLRGVVGMTNLVVVCDDYVVQKALKNEKIECAFAPQSLLKVMQDYTNGTGFDLVISYVQPEQTQREILPTLSLLSTWIIFSNHDNNFGLDPPDATYLTTKHCTLVLANTKADLIAQSRLYDGIITNILEEIVQQQEKGMFKLAADSQTTDVIQISGHSHQVEQVAGESTLVVLD